MSAPGEWLDRARCTQVDPDLFFPEKGSPAPEAKEICQQCEVRAECLAYALASPEHLRGIWGGLADGERRTLRRQMRAAA